MVKLPRLLAAPVLSLVLSLSLFSASAFAQNTDLNSAHSTPHPNVAAQPSNTLRPHDGPSPGENDYDGNGYGGNGYGGNGDGYGGGYGGNGAGYGGNGAGYGGNGAGYGGNGAGYGGYGGGNGGIGGGRVANWRNSGCFSRHCGSFDRGASRCVRLSRDFKSHWVLGRQGLSDCKWIKAEHW